MNDVVLPGSMLGLIGGGQLGRLFTLAARQMGYRVAVLDPDINSPAAQVASLAIPAAYDDVDAVADLARNTAAVAVEFENISAEVLEVASRSAPVFPQPHVMRIAQDRSREKEFLSQNGFPCVTNRTVRSANELDSAVQAVGLPALLKSASGGYDGKGQVPVFSALDLQHAWARLGAPEAVLEHQIAFECELSVIVARSLSGEIATYGPIRNIHFGQILDSSRYPAYLPESVSRQARELAQGIAESLDAAGLLCVEMFLMENGSLLVNELAPRPHNSGHLTIHSCATSQYEQLVRMMCGMPLGSTELLKPAAMVNLLGDLWEHGEPAWSAGLAVPGTYLTLYGKHKPSAKRKMGHITALADNSRRALEIAEHARHLLTSPQPLVADASESHMEGYEAGEAANPAESLLQSGSPTS